MSMRDRITSGVKWSSASQGGRQVMQIVTTIILARLLAPADFGIVGMAVVVIGFINLFNDLGTSAAVIQRKVATQGLFSTVFWVNLAFGITATALLFFAAPLGGLLFAEPRVVPVLQVLSFTFLFSALTIVQQAILERNLDFNRLAKVELGATFVGSVLGIALAFLGYGVWALVYQTLTTVALTSALLWLLSGWKPSLVFDTGEVRAVWQYSLNLTGFNVFNYFARNMDHLLIGRFLGAQALGYYAIAYRIMLYPLQNVSAVVTRVMFPVYSIMQDDDARFRSAYLRVVATVALVTFPLMAGIMAVAAPFVLTLFGVDWTPVIPLILILAPVGLVQSIGTTVGSIYMAKGRTDWMLRWGLFSGTVWVASFVIGLPWGVVGVATAYAVANILLTYPNLAIPYALIRLRVVETLRAVRVPLFASGALLAACLAARWVLPALPAPVELAVIVGLGAGVYGAVVFALDRGQLRELWELARARG